MARHRATTLSSAPTGRLNHSLEQVNRRCSGRHQEPMRFGRIRWHGPLHLRLTCSRAQALGDVGGETRTCSCFGALKGRLKKLADRDALTF